MDTRGARYAQGVSGGGVVVPTVGYNARKLRQWLRVTGGVPSRTGKDPVGQMLFLKHERPDVYEAAALFLEPMDYLNLRLTGRAVAAYDTIVGHWVTDNRDLSHVDYDDELIEWVGVDRSKLPELVPTGSIIGTAEPRGGAPSWACPTACRSSPAPATPPRPASARARCATSRATSTSARRRGCRATCPSRRPTSSRTSRRCRRASPAATGWRPSRTPPASA